MSTPPRLAERLLARFLPPRERDEVLGDMAERFARRAQPTPLTARLWYWRHALEIPARLAAVRLRRSFSLQEVRYALRAIAGAPVFSAVAVISLALGIGANTAIYSSMRALLFAEMPVESPQELEFLYHERPERNAISQFSSGTTTHPDGGAEVHSNISYPAFEAVRKVLGARGSIAGFSFVGQLSLAAPGVPAVAATGQMVSADYFTTVQPPLALGRGLGRDAPDEAVLSHSVWRRVFGGDPEVVGREVLVNGREFVVVGVTGPGFVGMSPGGFFAPTEITVSFAAQDRVAPLWARQQGSLFESRSMYWVRVILRLDADLPKQPLLDAMTAVIRAEMVAGEMVAAADAERIRARFMSAARGLNSLRAPTEQPLRILAVVVALVLLIACTNVANLMLARGAARQHELAVRRALGAGRGRLIRQLLTESLLIAFMGGALGLLFAVAGGRALTAALAGRLGAVGVTPELDLAMLGIAAAVSLAAGLLFGVLPSVRLSGGDIGATLGGRSASVNRGGVRAGRWLVAGQIAVSVPLIVGAGLFLRTLDNLGDIDLGFEPDNVVVFQFDAELVTDEVERGQALLDRVVTDLRAEPGVQAAGVLGNVLLGGRVSNGSVRIEEEPARMFWNSVSDDTFRVLGMELLSGRPVERGDDAAAPPVIVVNETAQREHFGGSAVGRTLRWGGQDWEVVGVVADAKYRNVRGAMEPTFYYSFRQRPRLSGHVVLQSSLSLGVLEQRIREVVAAVDPGVPVMALRTQEEVRSAALANELVFARLLTVFSLFALVIGCIGLFGVTSYAVSRRRPELGVRIALGARPAQIVWLVVGQVLVLTGIGVAVGVAAAAWLGPLVESMLYGVAPADPTLLIVASAVMAITAVVAAWLPAARAARTDARSVLSTD